MPRDTCVETNVTKKEKYAFEVAMRAVNYLCRCSVTCCNSVDSVLNEGNRRMRSQGRKYKKQILAILESKDW